MPEWWTYGLQDFLLFSPRVYWRMFELHNAAVWPSQIVALLLGAAILVGVARPRPWSDRAISAVLAAAWLFVAFAFLRRYATINWAAVYVVPAFAAEALLLVWIGVIRNRLRLAASGSLPGMTGLALFLYALVLHPFVVLIAGRPMGAAEVFGIAPDPTAIATLGLVLMAPGGPVTWLLLAVPLAWCIVSWATLHAMGTSEAWVPLTAAGLAGIARLWPAKRNWSARASLRDLWRRLSRSRCAPSRRRFHPARPTPPRSHRSSETHP